MSETIEISINGEPRRVPAGSTLSELVKLLDLAPERLAIELNLKIVRRNQWEETLLQPGDALEIVHFVGGG